MTSAVEILIADDDDGHARLIEKNLSRAGLKNTTRRFENGQQVLDFFFGTDDSPPAYQRDCFYFLLLDIRMPQVDGIEVLRQIKRDAHLRKVPVIMLTTTDDPREVDRCHAEGCNTYLVKPVGYEKFADTVKNLGLFISHVEIPGVNGPRVVSESPSEK